MAILHVVPKFVGLNNDEYQASFWVEVNPTPTFSDLAELQPSLTDWLQDMYDTIATRVRTTIVAIEYAIYLVDLITAEETFLGNGGWTFAGTDTGDSLPPQVSATLTAPVVGHDRPAQKRMIPMGETQQANGVLAAGTITALGNFGTEWLTGPLDTTNFTLSSVLFSKTTNQVYDWVGTVLVREDLGTMRNRKRGLGV
jgi:hypothetical protein